MNDGSPIDGDKGDSRALGEKAQQNNTAGYLRYKRDAAGRVALIEISACASNRLHYVTDVPSNDCMKKEKRRKRKSSTRGTVFLSTTISLLKEKTLSIKGEDTAP